MAGRVGSGAFLKRRAQNFTAFLLITAEQQVEQIFAVNGVAGIAGQLLGGKTVKCGAGEISRVRQ
jgi:hypothetical protein